MTATRGRAQRSSPRERWRGPVVLETGLDCDYGPGRLGWMMDPEATAGGLPHPESWKRPPGGQHQGTPSVPGAKLLV